MVRKEKGKKGKREKEYRTFGGGGGGGNLRVLPFNRLKRGGERSRGKKGREREGERELFQIALHHRLMTLIT